jgi:peptidyl-dipeptidase A
MPNFYRYLTLILSFFTCSVFSQEDSMQTLSQFLNEFISSYAEKSIAYCKAYWILQTTGDPASQDLVTQLSIERKLLLSDKQTYEKLLEYKKQKIDDPLLERELNILLRLFKGNMIPEELIEKISKKEAEISFNYANFRPIYRGKKLSQNDILEVLKHEKDPQVRKEIWEKSKEIGVVLAPLILEVVKLRNEAAHLLGYNNYFEMQLDLKEINADWLHNFLENLLRKSQSSFDHAIEEINQSLSKEYSIDPNKCFPWFRKDLFATKDPLIDDKIDEIYKNLDPIKVAKAFYSAMGIDVDPILQKSDLYEKEKKNQHAFCLNVDHQGDVRILMNVVPSYFWMGTTLHEFGHAIYDLGNDPELSYLLKSIPHMFTTEGVALLVERQTLNKEFLLNIAKVLPEDFLIEKMQKSLARRQLVNSRALIAMTAFEEELYRDPDQDLNALWWDLIEKYQKIPAPDRKGHQDWAALYHIGLSPVYLYSYVLGEVFASELKEKIATLYPGKPLFSKEASLFLQERLFAPGDSYSWDKLIEHVLDHPLNCDAWVKEFAY